MIKFCHLCALHHVKYQLALNGYFPEFISDAINEQFTVNQAVVSVKNLQITVQEVTKTLTNIDDLILELQGSLQ